MARGGRRRGTTTTAGRTKNENENEKDGRPGRAAEARGHPRVFIVARTFARGVVEGQDPGGTSAMAS